MARNVPFCIFRRLVFNSLQNLQPCLPAASSPLPFLPPSAGPFCLFITGPSWVLLPPQQTLFLKGIFKPEEALSPQRASMGWLFYICCFIAFVDPNISSLTSTTGVLPSSGLYSVPSPLGVGCQCDLNVFLLQGNQIIFLSCP